MRTDHIILAYASQAVSEISTFSYSHKGMVDEPSSVLDAWLRLVAQSLSVLPYLGR